MQRILILSLFLTLMPVFALAQTQKANPVSELQKVMEQSRKRMEESQKKELEELKKRDPELYKQRLKQIENQKEINKITASYRKRNISEEEAERKHYPLIKENSQGYLDNLDARIEQSEKKLKALKETKRNPDILIKKRIDALLGRSPLSPDDLLI